MNAAVISWFELVRWEIDNGGAPFLRPLPTPVPTPQSVTFVPPDDNAPPPSLAQIEKTGLAGCVQHVSPDPTTEKTSLTP